MSPVVYVILGFVVGALIPYVPSIRRAFYPD